MNAVDIRNTIALHLTNYLSRPVILSDGTQPEPEYPYMTYTPTSPYGPSNELGDHQKSVVPREDGDREILNIRVEQPDATFSFVACSRNREDGAEGYILGDDEAQALAEKAQGWFLHVGYEQLSLLGIVVVEVMNVGNRSTLEIEEAARRYGFDVRVRYTRSDARRDARIVQ